MTSGSSSRVISSTMVVMACGGAIVPAIVGGPMFALPFSSLVGGFIVMHVVRSAVNVFVVCFKEDWAVSSAPLPTVAAFSRPFRSMTTGGRDG